MCSTAADVFFNLSQESLVLITCHSSCIVYLLVSSSTYSLLPVLFVSGQKSVFIDNVHDSVDFFQCFFFQINTFSK